jgi:hypothetical protein
MRKNRLNTNPIIDNGIVTVYSNTIDVSYWIELIEKVNNESYPFEDIARRPHQTMAMPSLYNKKDSYSAIELRGMFYNILNESIVHFMQKNNMKNMEPLRDTITISKLFPGKPMKAHKDITDDRFDSFIAHLYINDNYEGGELTFPDNNYNYKPKAGDMAYYKMNNMHGVLETKSGLRYTVGYSLLGPYN